MKKFILFLVILIPISAIAMENQPKKCSSAVYFWRLMRDKQLKHLPSLPVEIEQQIIDWMYAYEAQNFSNYKQLKEVRAEVEAIENKYQQLANKQLKFKQLQAMEDIFLKMIFEKLKAMGETNYNITYYRSIDAKDYQSKTSLIETIYRNNFQAARFLIENGANVNAGNHWNNTPLHLVARQGNEEFVKLLLAHGAQVNAKNFSDETPLHWAAEVNCLGVLEILLDNGANVNAYSNKGTVLHMAASKGYEKRVKLFLERGADPSITSNGKTALELVAWGEAHDTIVNMIQNHQNLNKSLTR